MEYEELWKKGMIGKVVYDENEDTYRLEQKVIGFGLCEPLWQDYEGKRVKITIEVIDG